MVADSAASAIVTIALAALTAVVHVYYHSILEFLSAFQRACHLNTLLQLLLACGSLFDNALPPQPDDWLRMTHIGHVRFIFNLHIFFIS